MITVQSLDGVVFDAIVYGERQARQWIAGSDGFRRTEDVRGPEESSADQLLHLVIAYDADGTIRMYRNGKPYGTPYRSAALQTFAAGNWQVLFGLRHAEADPGKLFKGRIRDASVFDYALSADQVAALALGTTIVNDAEVVQSLGESQRAQYEVLRKESASLRERLVELTPSPHPSDAWTRLAHAMFNLKEFIYLR